MGEHITSSLESATQLKEKLMVFTLNVPRWLIFLLLIIGFLLLIVAFIVEIFTFGFVRMGWLYALGILMIVYSLIAALIPGWVLRKEQVVDSWSILIEKGKGRGEEIFDLQDLTAFTANCHHSLLKAVEKLMLSLNQDPSKIERKSRGFLGVS